MPGSRAVNIEFRLLSRGFENKLNGLSRELEKFERAATNLGQKLSIGLTAPIVLFGRELFESTRIVDRAIQRLGALTGEGEDLNAVLAELTELSFLPGLTFESTLKGVTNLRALNFSLQESEAILANASNAITLFGGSAEQLDGFILALTQIVGKGKVQAEEINQLAERFPQIRGILVDAFGTSFGPDINEGLVAAGRGVKDFVRIVNNELSKLTDAPLTVDSAFRTLKDTITVSLGLIGKDLADSVNLTTIFTNLSVKVLQIAEAFKQLDPETKKNAVTFLAIAAAIGPLLLILGAVAGAIANISSLFTLLGGLLNPVTLGIAAIVGIMVILHREGVNMIPVLGAIIDTFVFLGSGIIDSLSLALNGLIKPLKAIILAFQGKFGQAGQAMAELGEDFDATRLRIQNNFDAIFDSSTGFGDKLVSGIADTVNGVSSAFGGVNNISVDFAALNDKFRKELDLLGDDTIRLAGDKGKKIRSALVEPFERIDTKNLLKLDLGGFGVEIPIQLTSRTAPDAAFEALELIKETNKLTEVQTTQMKLNEKQWKNYEETLIAIGESLQDLFYAPTEAFFDTLIDAGPESFKSFNALFKLLGDAGSSAMKALGQAIVQMTAKLVSALIVATLLSVALSALGGFGGSIAGALGIGSKGSGIFKYLGSIFNNNSGFKFFAEGGIATKPTLGVFGEAGPEAVIPLNRLKDFGGTQVTITPSLRISRGDLIILFEQAMSDRKRAF